MSYSDSPLARAEDFTSVVSRTSPPSKLKAQPNETRVRVLGSKNMLERMAPCNTRVIRAPPGVRQHIVGDREQRLDVRPLELVHGKDVTADEVQGLGLSRAPAVYKASLEWGL